MARWHDDDTVEVTVPVPRATLDLEWVVFDGLDTVVVHTEALPSQRIRPPATPEADPYGALSALDASALATARVIVHVLVDGHEVGATQLPSAPVDLSGPTLARVHPEAQPLVALVPTAVLPPELLSLTVTSRAVPSRDPEPPPPFVEYRFEDDAEVAP